ncbi:hypothetical protein BDR05DRAFT_1057871 [Suillus weaverae]|nr:hypothetical protein BDR05DRAFT_1057871 [Suillus weaverae]
MTVVSNDPSLFPLISDANLISYCVVVSSVVVVYDWALTFGQEVELVWMRRWSLMNVLYICVRYIGILYSVIIILWNLPVSMTDAVGLIVYFISTWTPVVVNAILGVIMMFRIHAMYQRSKRILIFLVVVLLASTIASSVITVMANIGVSAGESVLSGYRICFVDKETNQMDLAYESVISTAIWEILAFVLAVWVVTKHLRELRQSPTRSTIGDYFTVLTTSHAFYFVAFAVVACFTLGSLSINVVSSITLGLALSNVLQMAQVLQMFVLGPRLILSVRGYHAKLVARSDEETGMTTLYFRAGGDALAGGDV